MDLTFELTKYDLHEFYKFHFWYSPDKKRYRFRSRIFTLSFMLIVELAFYYFIIEAPLNAIATLSLTSFGLLLLWYGYIVPKEYFILATRRTVDKIIKEGKNQDMFGKYYMQIKDNQIVVRTENSESKFNYQMIEKIRQDDNYFFIYLNLVSAVIIPKNILQSDKTKNEFNDFLKMWR